MSQSNASASALTGSPDDKLEVPPTTLPLSTAFRCRCRSDNENSCTIISSKGARSPDVTIETSTPVSSLVVDTLPPTRTYPFDLALGPEADQVSIYHGLASPMREEMQRGCDCLYGQMGPGKRCVFVSYWGLSALLRLAPYRHTMQDDLVPTLMRNPSAHTGTTPHSLSRRLHQLETTAADYSVKIPFAEPHNEELRDLVASHLSPPAGTTQPTNTGSSFISNSADRHSVVICERLGWVAATGPGGHLGRLRSVLSAVMRVREAGTTGDGWLKVGRELKVVNGALREEVVARQAYQGKAGMLNRVTGGLKKVTKDSASDTGGLFNKIREYSFTVLSLTHPELQNERIPFSVRTRRLYQPTVRLLRPKQKPCQRRWMNSSRHQGEA